MMRQILLPIDVAIFQRVKSNPTRRSCLEKYVSTQHHSFVKVQPRLERLAKATGRPLADYLLIEKLGEGLQKESWYKPGPVLRAIPSDELVLLERVLSQTKSSRPNTAS